MSCRRHFVLKYFGESSPEQCGNCDICLGRHDRVVITPDDEPQLRQLLKYIRDDVPRGLWFEGQPASQIVRIRDLIMWLYQEAYIEAPQPLEERYTITEKASLLLKDWMPVGGESDTD